jgi:hypothetical protein
MEQIRLNSVLWLISLSSGSFKDWLISLSLILNMSECHDLIVLNSFIWLRLMQQIWLMIILLLYDSFHSFKDLTHFTVIDLESFFFVFICLHLIAEWFHCLEFFHLLQIKELERTRNLFDGLRILNSKDFRMKGKMEREVSYQLLLWWGLWIFSSLIPFACCRRKSSCLGHFAKASFGTPLLWHRQRTILNGFQSSCLCGWTILGHQPSSCVAYRAWSPACSVAVWLI